MLAYSLLILTIFFQSAFAAAHPNRPLHRRASIPLPSNDPFYSPPEGWESADLGHIYRSRKVDLAFVQVDKFNYQAAYQLLYRTTDVYEDQPSYTVTTVIIPHNAKSDQLINYNTFIDAVGSKCVPSYTMRLGGNFGTDLALNAQQLFFGTLLDQGYILTVPDYQGPNRAFVAGRMEGRMALDAVRATLNFKRLGLSKNTKVVGHGYSGGAVATGWAAALHPSYAPEINAVGFAVGGTPVNLTSAFQLIDGGLFGGFVVSGVAGFMNSYPDLRRNYQSRLTSYGRTALNFAQHGCLLDVVLRYPFAKFSSDQFLSNGTDFLSESILQKNIGDLVMGLKKNETPTAPVYMFHGRLDELVPYNVTLNAGHKWVNHGANVLFQEDTDDFSAHEVTQLRNFPNVMFFAQDRFAGKPFPKGFTKQNVVNGLANPLSSLAGLGELVSSIEDLIGKEVGPADSLIRARIKQNAS